MSVAVLGAGGCEERVARSAGPSAVERERGAATLNEVKARPARAAFAGQRRVGQSSTDILPWLNACTKRSPPGHCCSDRTGQAGEQFTHVGAHHAPPPVPDRCVWLLP